MNALRSHRYLMRVALAAVNLFSWIFVFQYFFARYNDFTHAFLGTIFVYVLVHTIVLLVTPLSAKRLRNGIKWPMTQGVICAAAAYSVFALSLSGFFGAHILPGILLYAVFRGLYHALYWVPYSVDAQGVGERKPLTRLLQEGSLALIPAIAGLILTNGISGLNALFYGAAALTLLSIVPLLYIQEIHEGYSWGYAESFHNLLKKRHRHFVSTAFLDGISGAGLLLFWPITIFLLIGWSYAMLGIVMSVTYLLVFLTRSYVSGFLQRGHVGASPLVHAFLAVSGWLLRLTVATPLGVVLVDSYFYTGTQVRGTGINTLLFEQSADRGSYIDEYTTLKEISLAIGKIFLCVVAGLFVVTLHFSIALIGIFLLAAVASGVSVFLSRQKTRL